MELVTTDNNIKGGIRKDCVSQVEKDTHKHRNRELERERVKKWERALIGARDINERLMLQGFLVKINWFELHTNVYSIVSLFIYQ